MNSIRSYLIAVLALMLFATLGCEKNTRTHTKSSIQTQSKSFLMNADDLDMDTISALVRAESIGNIEDLQTKINGPASGLNNVDIDKDGKIDTIVVTETRDGESLVINFNAVPSSTENIAEAQTVAFLRMKHNSETNQVHVSGGYPDYVGGGGYYDYHVPYHRSTASQMAGTYFMMRAVDRMFMPSYRGPQRFYSRGMYRSRMVMPRSQVISSRTSYRTKTSVAPVKRQTVKPKNFKASKSAMKTASSYKAKGYGTKKGNDTIGGARGKAKSYGKTTKPKHKATGFGGSSSKRKSTGWGGSSSKRKSTGWGGSSSKRSRPTRSRSSSRRRSDLTLKTNVVVISNAAERLQHVRGVTWAWKDKTTAQPTLGVIAQEVESQFPELVEWDETGVRIVHYDLMVGVLIQAFKEQNARIEALETSCNP